jgi:hypothetical protein
MPAALGFTMATCTTASPIVLHPCTEERWQVSHLELVPLPPELFMRHGADTHPTHLAAKIFSVVRMRH